MLICSWNINGIRSNILNKELKINDSNLEQLFKLNPDIICFQETKCSIQIGEKLDIKEYPYQVWNESKGEKHRGTGYSGTAILSKIKPIQVKFELDGFENKEGRFIFAEFENFSLINIYVPNSGTNFKHRTEYWDKNLKRIMDSYNEKPLIITGDLNVVSGEKDIHSINTLKQAKSPGVLKEERYMFQQFLENYIDIYRELYPEEKKWTWWNMRTKSRESNKGWRIDYFLINKKYKDIIQDCQIENGIIGSDHCPIWLKIKD